jgi:14-3-3 protein epsilon
MSTVDLENLSIQEDDGFVFDLDDGEEGVIDFRWCLVGRFLGDRSIHVNSMKVTMADVWRPVKGVKIKEATTGLFLFQFAHALDMEAVIKGGPWAFNNQMLILERVGLGVQIETIPLNHVDFWVQVHNLPTGLMAEKVGKTLANYIGSFVEYDKNNTGCFWREYMRIRVRVDIRQPLKKDTRVKNQGGNWCTVNFKYEKLGVFCFVCGLIGHGENRCAVRFSMAEDDGSRAWSKDLRAEPRRRGGRQTSRWLTEDDGGRSEQDGNHVHGNNQERRSHSHSDVEDHYSSLISAKK